MMPSSVVSAQGSTRGQGSIPGSATMSSGVTVAREILALQFWVRLLARQPIEITIIHKDKEG